MAQIDTSAIALPLAPAPNANPTDSRAYGPRGDCGLGRGVAFSLPLQVIIQAPFLRSAQLGFLTISFYPQGQLWRQRQATTRCLTLE